MAPLTPEQRRRQARFEQLIALMAPGLNLILAIGERVSRIAEPEDHEYYPLHSGSAGELPAPADEPAER